MQNFLSSLTVIELASVLAGPAVGQFFAELGAKVIKIENARTQGDVTRSWKLPTEDSASEESAYYRAVNWGKSTQLLDLRKSKDQTIVHELVKEADVVISNFSPAAGRKLAMDGPTLRALNPQLIFARLDAFSPESRRPAYDIVLQAETGFLSMNGTAAGQLCRMPVALIDILAAHQLKEGILLALLRRATSQKGATVTASLYHSALASLANQATNYLIADQIAQPMGCQHPNIAPYGDIFELADGARIVLAIGSDQQFSALCDLLGLPQVERFQDNQLRVQNRSALIDYLQLGLAKRQYEELAAAAEAARIPIGRIRNMAEVFALAAAQSQLLHYPNGDRAVKTVSFQLED
ncbi:MAG: CoA transferase [Bacteroidota bacterium]